MSRAAYTYLIQITGFLAACLAIYTFYFSPSERLEADVYYADFELPVAVAQQVGALTPLTSYDSARNVFFKGVGATRLVPGTVGAIDQVVNNITAFVKEKAPLIEHSADYRFKGFWRITVRNSGSRTASTVVIHFPVQASAVVSRPHENSIPLQQLPTVNTQAIVVGNVQGGEYQIIVYAWTLAEATEDLAKKITLSQDLGAGRVKIVH